MLADNTCIRISSTNRKRETEQSSLQRETLEPTAGPGNGPRRENQKSECPKEPPIPFSYYFLPLPYFFSHVEK